MEKPFVSVKMITYNHAASIGRAIEGVLRQETGFPFELVIGEDCSTDGTRETVFEYARKHPRVIRVVASDRNVGGKQNSWRTARACLGKYVAMCEGDDYWHRPDKLQKQADYLESHPECGLVYSSFDLEDPGSGRKIEHYLEYRKWDMPENPRVRDFVEGREEIGLGVLTCTVMLRRDLYERVIEADPYLHQSPHFLMGDTQLWAEAAELARFHYLPESLATHVLTSESATRSKDIRKVLRFSVSSAELFLYLAEKYRLPEETKKKHFECWCDASLRLAFHTRDASLGEEVLRKKGHFTPMEWLRYWGARNPAVHSFCRGIACFTRREKPSLWLRGLNIPPRS